MSFGKIVVTVVSVFGLTLAACGGDDSSGGGTGGSGAGGSGGSSTGGSGGCGGGGGNDCPAYTDCMQQKCDAEYKECLGAGYKTGNFAGGKCATYMECVSKCNCDTTCQQKCTMESDCSTCMTTTLGGCASNCSAELQQCAGSGGATGTGGAGTGGGSGGGTCADLQACCAKLSGADKTNCDTTYSQVKAGGDAACNVALQSYTASGKC